MSVIDAEGLAQAALGFLENVDRGDGRMIAQGVVPGPAGISEWQHQIATRIAQALMQSYREGYIDGLEDAKQDEPG